LIKINSIKKLNQFTLLGTILIFILLVCFSLSTWKMFQFRDRLHALLDNGRWEKSVFQNEMYDSDLIIFFGDSQIALWPMAPSFGSFPIVNKGVSGDWASKAVDRFSEDVLALKPKLLIMLIGTNDLGHGKSAEEIIRDIEIMLVKAVNKNIRVVLCSLLPVRGKYIVDHSLKDILKINNKLKSLSYEYDADYVDFYSKLLDMDGAFNGEYTEDGLHLNKLGYIKISQIMLPVLVNNAAQFMKY